MRNIKINFNGIKDLRLKIQILNINKLNYVIQWILSVIIMIKVKMHMI